MTDGTSTAGYAADSQSIVTGDSISVGNPKSDFTQLDTEAWIQSLAVRAAKHEDEKCSTLSRLTRQNILALDLMLADGKPKTLADEESSVYSVDQEGFYTSFHNDSGLKKSTNTLVDDDDEETVDFSPTKDSISVCSADSVIHRPTSSKSEKFAGLRKGNSGGTLKVVSKVTPPAPPQRTTSKKSYQEGEVTPTNTPELHSFPSQDSSVSESDAEAVFNRVHDKTTLSSTGFPSLVALSTSDDESSPETKSVKAKGLSQSTSVLGLSGITDTSNFSSVSYQSGSVYDSTNSDNSFNLLKHSVSTLECTQNEFDTLTGTLDQQSVPGRKSQAGYQSWPRSHKNTPSGILKTPEKQFDVTRPQKTLNFAPVVNLFKEGALNSVQMPLPSPTNSSCSESNGPFGMPHMSSFQSPPTEEHSFNLTIPIDQNNQVTSNQDSSLQPDLPLKYQPLITVTPRSRSGDYSGQGSETGSRQQGYSNGAEPSAQSTPFIDQNSNKRSSPVLYAVSPVMAPKDPSRQNSLSSNSSNHSGYMDMQTHLRTAGSLNSLTSSEGFNESSTYMSMSSPCSSPNLSHMDFPISNTPSGSMDSLLDLRKTPTNELENDTYRINTSIPVNRQYSSGSQSSLRENSDSVPVKPLSNGKLHNNDDIPNGSYQSNASFRTPNSSSSMKYTPGRRSIDSNQSDLTCVTPMSLNSSIGSNGTPISRNSSTPVSHNSINGQREPQSGRRSRADERKEPSYRNYKASNRRSLPSDMSHTNTHIRHVPLNDTPSARNMSNQNFNHSQKSMSSSKSCPVGFNSVLLSNSSYSSGSNNSASSINPNTKRQPGYSPSSNDDPGSGSRSDSYRVAMNSRTSSYRNAMHQSKSFPNLPPSRQSGPFRVAMDMSPNRAFNQCPDDEVMSRADSYRIAVRNTNPLIPADMANRNTSYRVAINDDVPSVVNSKLEALGMDDKKLMSGRDVRRMGITDVDQVKDVNPKVVMRESKSTPNIQLRIRDSKPSPNAMGPSASQTRASQQQTQQSSGRIRKCTKQDVDPIQIVATVDTTNDSKKTGKNNPNRSSTYIQFDPIFEDTEDFTNAADLDMSSLDYSMNLSKTSKSKFGLINGTVTDANANNVKPRKTTKSSKNSDIEDNWRFSQV